MFARRAPFRSLVGAALTGAMMLAGGGSIDALTFQELPEVSKVAAMASLALRGRISDIDYGYVEVSDKQTIPYSRIRLDVGRSFGGTSASQVTLRQLGGRLKNHATRYLVIHGLADLAPGERIYVLANDRLQPFFATLYGDHSLFRIAQDERGRQRVLNAHWQQLATDGERIWPVHGLYCEAVKENRGQCREQVRAGSDVSDTDDVAAREGRPLDVGTFDALLGRWRAAAAAAPGQTVSDDDEAFSAALRAFGLTVSAPAAKDSENEIPATVQ